MSFVPFDDRVLVRKGKSEQEMTEGGLFVPATAEKTVETAKVVAVGPGRILQTGEYVARDIAVDDIVKYQKGLDLEIKVGTETLYIVECRDVLGKVL